MSDDDKHDKHKHDKQDKAPFPETGTFQGPVPLPGHDLSKAKKSEFSAFPAGVVHAVQGQERIEAYLDAELFKSRFLFGLPLVSPLTKERISSEMLQDYINRAANQLEIDTKIHVFPVIIRDRQPFLLEDYLQYVYLELPTKPIQKIISLSISSANYEGTGRANQASQYPQGSQIYTFPPEWISMANSHMGRINIVPLSPAFGAISSSQAAAENPQSAGSILNVIGLCGYIPGYWLIEYVAGFCTDDGKCPSVINEAIGQLATVKLMDNLIPLYGIVSQSLSIDGLGQSSSNQIQALLKQKRDDAFAEYLRLVNKIRAYTNQKFFSTAL